MLFRSAGRVLLSPHPEEQKVQWSKTNTIVSLLPGVELDLGSILGSKSLSAQQVNVFVYGKQDSDRCLFYCTGNGLTVLKCSMRVK